MNSHNLSQFGILFLASTCSCLQFQWNRKYLSSAALKITWPTLDGSVAWFPLAWQRKDDNYWFLHERLLLDWLIFLLFLLHSVCWSKYSAKTTKISTLNVFLHLFHQFVRKHFRIFVRYCNGNKIFIFF